MDFELFIKDNCFLPETVDIKVNSTLIFKNTDSIQHTIRCKGSASFPEFVLEAGRSSKFKFDKPGRYEISEADIGDMKCIVEATEQENENIPKRNYFPTSKEKKFLAEQELLKKRNEHLQALLESTPTSPADFPELFPSPGKGTEAVQPNLEGFRGRRNLNPFSKGRPKQEWSGSDSDGSEEADILQQRRRLKAATQKYASNSNTGLKGTPPAPHAAPSSGTPTYAVQPPRPPTPSDANSSSLSASNSAVTASSCTSTSTSTSSRISSGSLLAGRNSAGSGSRSSRTAKSNTSTSTCISANDNTFSISDAVDTNVSLSALPSPVRTTGLIVPICVTIEDYAFAPSAVEISVGQSVHFVLAATVPSHAEHELYGASAVKELCFESPLLQKGECTNYTFSPACAGEVVVSCRIYPEMQCTVVVHPARAAVSVSGSLLGQARTQGTAAGTGGRHGKVAGAKAGVQNESRDTKGGTEGENSEKSVPTAGEESGRIESTVHPSAVSTPQVVPTADATPGAAQGTGVPASTATGADHSNGGGAARRPFEDSPNHAKEATSVLSTHTTPSGTVVFTPAGKRSPMGNIPSAGSAPKQATEAPRSPVSPSTAALQGTGSKVLKIDPGLMDARHTAGLHGGGNLNGYESDSSKNSFMDSDDATSASDLEGPKSNLGRLFREADAQRVPAASVAGVVPVQTAVEEGRGLGLSAEEAVLLSERVRREEERDLRSEVLFARPTRVPLQEQLSPQQQRIAAQAPYQPTRAPFVPYAFANSNQAGSSSASSSGVLVHTVDLEEYSFKPASLVIKAGERVRFLRSASLLATKVFCDGEFPPTALDTPIAAEHTNEPYVCFEHTFQNVGKFDVQNEIYCFFRCAIVVVPSTSAAGGGGELRQRRGYKLGAGTGAGAGPGAGAATPALLGSFTTAVPAQPVFHRPLDGSASGTELAPLRTSPHRLPPLSSVLTATVTASAPATSALAPTTTTTVNASTTTVTATTAACADAVPVQSSMRTHSPTATITEPAAQTDADLKSTQRAVKPSSKGSSTGLYGSFLPASSTGSEASPASLQIDKGTDDFIQSFLATDLRPLPAIPTSAASAAAEPSSASHSKKAVAKGAMEPIDEDGESAAEAEDAAMTAAQAAKRKARNRKKRDRQKEKSREQREQIEASVLGIISEDSVEPAGRKASYCAGADEEDEDAAINERTPLLPKELGTENSSGLGGESTEGRCTYQSDSALNRAYLTAAADWQEEFDTDDDKPTVNAANAGKQQSAEGRVFAVAAVQAPPEPVETAVASMDASQPLIPTRQYADAAMQTPSQPVADVADTAVAGADAEAVSGTDSGAQGGKKKRKKRGARGGGGGSSGSTEVTAAADASAVPIAALPVSEPVPVITEGSATEEGAQGTVAEATAGAEQTSPTLPEEPAAAAADIAVAKAQVPAPAEETATATSEDAAAPVNVGPADAAPNQPVLVTPKKTRPAKGGRSTPPVSSTPPPTHSGAISDGAPTVAAESASKRHSSLLRNVLKITPQKASGTTTGLEGTNTGTGTGTGTAPSDSAADHPGSRTPSPSLDVEDDSDTGETAQPARVEPEDSRLSMLVAYEQQMEEFFMSRYDGIEALHRHGKTDRLPSGKEVEIIYLEDLLLLEIAVAPTKTKSRFHGAQSAATGGAGATSGGGGGGKGAHRSGEGGGNNAVGKSTGGAGKGAKEGASGDKKSGKAGGTKNAAESATRERKKGGK